ncbi:hypothetical protein [Haliscomenobacter hydrossis]|uniref:Uncharacterized protein n=1 Tax=Haliscomenobacter hydrossis (strain ATCC 27775 / DSM 1100 / LMG 10767 / O) TaxID=760192 RepID=F4KV38_HALH1|nr:hypothetical protein [Haliscomenobacter hydrossis]AEE49204.1 hypothetical protein Halhy_1309 [Haliscomenobacter hydrossis DSM 1100]
MQAIRTLIKSTSGVLTIEIPEAFINNELEIIILLSPEVSKDEPKPLSQYEKLAVSNEVNEHTERYLIAQQYKGDALFPDFPTDELNVYEQ